MADHDASIRVSTKVDNSDLKELQKEFDKINEKLEGIKQREKKLENAGIDKRSKIWKMCREEALAYENQLADINNRIQEATTLNTEATTRGFARIRNACSSLFNVTEKGTNKSSKLLITMGSRLKGIALTLLVFNWISKGFNAMVSAMKAGFQNLAQYSKEYNKVMSDMKSQSATLKNSLATAFEPIVTTIVPYITQLISWLNTAMNYIAQFWAALSGKDTYTRAKKQVVDYAKSLKDAGGTAKGALASFDEINVLNKDEGNGSAGGEVTGADAFEEVKVSGFSWIEEMKEALDGLVDYFIQPFAANKAKFEETLNGFADVARNIWGTLKETVSNTFGTFMEVYELHFKPFLDSIIMGVSELVGAFLDFWNTYAQPVLDNLAAKFDEVMSAHIQPMIDRFLELLGSIADALLVFWETSLKPLVQWIIDNILPVLMPIFEDIATGIFDLFAFVADIFENLIGLLKGVIDFVVAVFTGDWEGAWDAIKNILQNAIDIMSSIIGMGFATIENIIKTVLDIIYGVVKGVFDGICAVVSWVMKRLDTIISGILGGINKKWLAAWNEMKKGITNVLNGILWVVKDIVNNIIGAIEMMVNGIIKGINFAIDALNGMGFDVPDWVPYIGGSSFHLNISRLSEVSIPRLATGGIVTSSTLANIGEAGREAVLPLDNNTGWMDDLANKINGDRTINITFEGSLAELGRILKPVIDTENSRVGRSLAQT